MARNTSVILGEHFDNFIKTEVKSGRYGSASELIRSGLRLLEDQQARSEAINKALNSGEKSGIPLRFDNEEFKKVMKNKLKINA